MNENGLDQFYTNQPIALKCYAKLQKRINIQEYDYYLEPSAGSGSFYTLLDIQKRVGLDLDPKCEGVRKEDYLQFVPEKNKKYLVIGNPPFGKVSSLAIKFFNKSAEFADCIAFIIPRTFKRVSIQNKLSMNFTLLYNKDLPLTPCCFTPKMSAKCCFQIWKRTKIPRVPIKLDKIHRDFTFVKYGPKNEHNQPTPPEADMAVRAYGSNCGEIRDTLLSTLSPKSWHWINARIDTEELKKRFTSLNYSISTDTVRQDSIGQQELIQLYKLKYG
jgi:hypothetical protein